MRSLFNGERKAILVLETFLGQHELTTGTEMRGQRGLLATFSNETFVLSFQDDEGHAKTPFAVMKVRLIETT